MGLKDQLETIREMAPTNQFFDDGDPRRVIWSPPAINQARLSHLASRPKSLYAERSSNGDSVMTTPLDPCTPTLLAHKGSPVPLEPARMNARPEYLRHLSKITSLEPARDDWRQGDRAASSMPWPTRDPAEIRRATGPDLDTKALKPLYTEKLATSPHFPTLAEASQRRRDFWSKVAARGSLGLMVGAVVGAFWFGTGVFPAGAFVVGLILFGATCFVSGCRNRGRV